MWVYCFNFLHELNGIQIIDLLLINIRSCFEGCIGNNLWIDIMSMLGAFWNSDFLLLLHFYILCYIRGTGNGFRLPLLIFTSFLFGVFYCFFLLKIPFSFSSIPIFKEGIEKKSSVDLCREHHYSWKESRIITIKQKKIKVI